MPAIPCLSDLAHRRSRSCCLLTTASCSRRVMKRRSGSDVGTDSAATTASNRLRICAEPAAHRCASAGTALVW